ncbi:MAG: tRNA-specific adenosine deaminase, partial [Lactobacillus crispatus]|nr:tRNA-specific adenosine deaminase [Lactobacillus crispatus]
HAIRGLYRDQCAQMLKDFFRAIREKQKAAKLAQKEV